MGLLDETKKCELSSDATVQQWHLNQNSNHIAI
jgi:hypothetical protein